MGYADFYRRSIEDRDAFWAEQAKLIDWQTPPAQICDASNPPFARWFAGVFDCVGSTAPPSELMAEG